MRLIAILWAIFKCATIIFITVLYSRMCLRMWDKAAIKLLWLHFQVHQCGNECDWCAQYDSDTHITHMKKNRETYKRRVRMMYRCNISVFEVLAFEEKGFVPFRNRSHSTMLNLYILQFSNADPWEKINSATQYKTFPILPCCCISFIHFALQIQ